MNNNFKVNNGMGIVMPEKEKFVILNPIFIPKKHLKRDFIPKKKRKRHNK